MLKNMNSSPDLDSPAFQSESIARTAECQQFTLRWFFYINKYMHRCTQGDIYKRLQFTVVTEDITQMV